MENTDDNKTDERRLNMPILNSLPREIFYDSVILPNKELEDRISSVKDMTLSEIQEEVMDLLKEKDYLILAIEYLKQRITK